MTKPWIYVDFNKRVGADTYRLTTLGTRNDLQRQGLTLRPGFAFVAYMEDETADGAPCYLAADAAIVQADNGELLAQAIDASFREEPRK